jgi:predicted enzyme related to lactoylglutathione lyase
MNTRPYAVWFDIPVANINRAINFYAKLLQIELKEENFEGVSMAVFPHHEGQIGGCLYQAKDNAPSKTGLMLYFSAEGRLDEAVEIAIKEGGKVIQPKHQIGPHGFRAIILDSEGNLIALHSMAS